MANWYGTMRSNYFRVKDEAKFTEWLALFPDLTQISKTTEDGSRVGFYDADNTGSVPMERWTAADDAEPVEIDDAIRGKVVRAESRDFVIFRSDGSSTFHFVNVVDDIAMGITHVIRGDDHVNNTPRQVKILQALGKTPPRYAHVPMILGDDGSRLSKRHGAVSVMEYRNQGILPEALLNYLVRLGWSHGDEELFTLDQMVELFDIADVNKAASAFNTEKLLWINQHYIKKADPTHLARLLSPHLGELGIDPAGGPDLVEVVRAQQERAQTLVEMAEISAFFYRDYEVFEEKAAKKHLRAVALEPLRMMRERLAGIDDWTGETLHQAVIDVSESLELKMGKVAQPLRVAVVGRAASPGIDVTLELVGKDASLRRIDRALDYIHARMEENAT